MKRTFFANPKYKIKSLIHSVLMYNYFLIIHKIQTIKPAIAFMNAVHSGSMTTLTGHAQEFQFQQCYNFYQPTIKILIHCCIGLILVVVSSSKATGEEKQVLIDETMQRKLPKDLCFCHIFPHLTPLSARANSRRSVDVVCYNRDL